jgi:formylglycine-generating enzyme required for sulfatase activity
MSTTGEPASKDFIGELIHILAEDRKFSSTEIAETLWLSLQIQPSVEIVTDEPQPIDEIVGDKTESVTEPPSIPSTPFEPRLQSAPRVNVSTSIPKAGVLPAKALPVWIFDPPMLTDALSIMRALKPLLRKVATGAGRKLDESATVDQVARTQLCLPILEPDCEPWFDIVLAVDRGQSMHLWQRLADDLVRVLRRYGAFRDLQVFDIEVNTTAQKSVEPVLLRSHPTRPGHRPSELIDQRGRRIVIVLSDCAGEYWWDGTLLPMLQTWSKAMPVVIWQMLPEWMWERTALGRGNPVALRNCIPGASNQRLMMRLIEREVPNDAQQRVSIPVVTSEVRSLSNWSLMLAGDRREVTPGFLLPQRGGRVPRAKAIEAIARDRLIQNDGVDSEDTLGVEIESIARDRVQRFRQLSSPQARRLVMLLSAAPVITLPVMRLIRDSMMHEVKSPIPVAEVFLSGLLQRLSGQENIEPNLVQYDFVSKAREVLLQVLPEVETIEVINSVSAAVEKNWNQHSSQDFRAFLTNPQAEVPEGLEGLRSFASVTANILERLGGEYASFVRQLRQGTGEEPLPENIGFEEDFPLQDLEYEVAKLIDFPPLQPCEYEFATISAILDPFEYETATISRQNRLLVLRSAWIIRRRRATAWGYTEIISTETGEEIGLDLMAILGGSFKMGAPNGESDSPENERPQHQVTLQPFYLGRYAVTQAQWQMVAGYKSEGRELNADPSAFKRDNRPVENVSWEDAQEFCKRLSKHSGKPYRLPSEAEWEYACRAGTETPFHFGATISPELANYDGTSTYKNSPKGKFRGETSDVGSFPANDWGLHDMHGNVFEWCQDNWYSNYEGAPIDGSAWLTGNENDTHIIRGGSWNDDSRACRSACRYYNTPDYRNDFVGFRLACDLPRTLHGQNW